VENEEANCGEVKTAWEAQTTDWDEEAELTEPEVENEIANCDQATTSGEVVSQLPVRNAFHYFFIKQVTALPMR